MIPLDIKERNAWFKSLTIEEKRVAIAKDVIEQVKIGKYNARHGVYFGVRVSLQEGDSFQEVVDSNECTVCAMGGLFASRVRLGNEANVDMGRGVYNQFTQGLTMFTRPEDFLQDIFEPEQYRLMEVAFEGHDAVGYFEGEYGNWYEDECDSYLNAVQLHDDFSSDTERLIAIMENLIANKGMFIP